MVRNPVMFVTRWQHPDDGFMDTALLGHGEVAVSFVGGVTLWLVVVRDFANFSEALAEGRGKAQAAHYAAPAVKHRRKS